MGSWWREKYKNRSRTVVPVATECKRVHSHVFSTVLNGRVNWPWSGATINKVRAWEAKILRLTFRPRMKPDETWVGDSSEFSFTKQLEEYGSTAADRKLREKSGPL